MKGADSAPLKKKYGQYLNSWFNGSSSSRCPSWAVVILPFAMCLLFSDILSNNAKLWELGCVCT